MPIGTTAELLPKFRAAFPEYPSDEVSDEVVTRWINEARQIHAVKELATLYCAAHLLTLAEDEDDAIVDGGAGEVMGETVGAGFTGFKTQAKDETEAFFARTRYGRMFLTLERRTARVRLSFGAYG